MNRGMLLAMAAGACVALNGVGEPWIEHGAVRAQPERAAAGPNAGAANEVRGTIDSVTVYRGQALVTRAIALEGPAGLREVVVTDLPAQVDASSLHAESTESVQVRSVRYRTRPVAQDVRAEVRALDEQLAQLKNNAESAARRAEVLAEHKAFLENLKTFVAPTAQTELTKGVLNAETLERLTRFIRQQRDELVEQELKLSLETQEIKRATELKDRERQRLASGSSRTVREAVLFVNKVEAGPAQVKLRYLVNEATWEPSYNVRSGPAAAPVSLEFMASIQQMSGEDWGNVSMTLSTATPALVAKAPTLAPMTIALTANVPQAQTDAGMYEDARRSLAYRQKELDKSWMSNTGASQPGQGGGGGGVADQRDEEKKIEQGLNRVAAEMQVLDLVAGGRVERKSKAAMPEPAARRDEGVSVVYSIKGATTLPSRNDRQLVQIASIPLKAERSKVGIPVLTEFVYDEAVAANSSGMVLLAGPFTAYMDGAFVGSGQLPTVAVGERFAVGFGIDSSLRTARELVEKTETLQGGNRIVDLTYRITIENFGEQPAKLRVTDRLPKIPGGTGTPAEIKLTLLSSAPEPVGSHGEQLNGGTNGGTHRKDGILAWDLTVPAQSIGEKASVIEYRFRLEYDKQMAVVGMER